jgi:pimeloyl-ACP methyl ester carboxylesterase
MYMEVIIVNSNALLCIGVVMVLLLSLVSGCGSDEKPSSKIVSEEVTWPIGDTTVYATLTRPESGNNLPAVVFIAGSGPTDRNWNSPLLPGTNGSAGLLAEALAAQGYVTLRYDKRASGPHAQENMAKLIGKMSMQSHLDEVNGAVAALLARKDVDPKRIYVLGNSEGTIHAVNYQLQENMQKWAGMILTGAPGRSIGELSRAQIAAQFSGLPNGQEIMDMYDKAIASFIATSTMEPDPSLPEGIRNVLLSLTSPANLPFARELWTADIAPLLPQIDVPVLVIIGKKDIQVDWEADGGKLQAAAAGKENITFSFPEDANHILKHETRPKNEITADKLNYNEAGTVLDAPTLEIIENWLDDHAK